MTSRFMGPVGWPRGERIPGADPLALYRGAGRHLLLTHTGRTAIDLAVRALDLRPGDEMLVPSYSTHCEVDALRRHGATPVVYPVRRTCAIDLEAAMQRAGGRVRALYVIHYFGFPQPATGWLAAARARGWAVVEDCAHGLFGCEDGIPLGTRGDLGIFSFRKTLGVPDGGFLLANRPIPSLPAVLPARPAGGVAAAAARQWLLGHAPAAFLRIAHRLARQVHSRPESTGPRDAFDPGMKDRGPSAWTSGLLERIQPELLVRTQRANFQRLLDGCPRTASLRPLFDHLPAGANPLCFPVWCSQRRALQLALAGRGIVAYRLWGGHHRGVDLSGHAETRELKDHVLTLPVHYQLAGEDVAAMMDALRSWTREGHP